MHISKISNWAPSVFVETDEMNAPLETSSARRDPPGRWLLQAFQGLQHLGVVRRAVQRVHLGKHNLAALIYNEYGPSVIPGSGGPSRKMPYARVTSAWG